MSFGGPDFSEPVAPGGYAWWYVDALSDNGENAIVIIAFIGSVFSPYYALARRRGITNPHNHCAINVALYGKRGGRWAMTERPSRALDRSDDYFRVGPSALAWDGEALTINLDEIAVPIPKRIRGQVRVTPTAVTRQTYILNAAGAHRWWPIAPCARVEVVMQHPQLRWQGDGYFDTNRGDAPLEDGFRHWQWARGATRDGAAILYEGETRGGARVDLAMTIDRSGVAAPFAPPPLKPLPRSLWRIGRSVRSETDPCLERTLEDAPFYARSIVDATLQGERVTLMHESLALDRFRMPIVQAMLPFRMPRARR